MSRLGLRFCKKLLEQENISAVLENNIDAEMFEDEARTAFEYIKEHYINYGVFPTKHTIFEEKGVQLDPGTAVRDGALIDVGVEAPEPFQYYLNRILLRAKLNDISHGSKDFLKYLKQDKPDETIDGMKDLILTIQNKYGTSLGTLINIMDVDRDENGVLVDPAGVLAEYHRMRAYGGIDGIHTPWQSLTEATQGWHAGELVSVVARLGVGKCMTKCTNIPDPVTGLNNTIQDCVENQTPVFTYDRDDAEIKPIKPSAWIYTGKKECLRVKTRLGRKVEVTPEHPLLTSSGWVRADQLSKGMKIVGCARLPEPIEAVPIEDWEVDLLGALLSEGGYTGNETKVTTADHKFLQVVKDAAKSGNIDLEVSRSDSKSYRLINSGTSKRSRGRQSNAKDFREKFNLGSKKAIEKRIPDAIFRLPNNQLARFIAIFWMGDGSVGVGGRSNEISIGLGSEQMIDDLQHLLLRFGVVARKRYKPVKYQGGIKNSWELRVEAWTRHNFRDNIKIPGRKGRILAQAEDLINTNTDSVPASREFINTVKKSQERHLERKGSPQNRNGLFKKAAKILGVNSGLGLRDFVNKNNSGGGSRIYIKALIEVADGDLDQFKWLVSDDVVFDEIISIEEIGEHDVYDLTVPGTNNFIANDIISHNTFWGLMCISEAHRRGHKCLIISMEMTIRAMTRRFYSVRYTIPYRQLKQAEMSSAMEEHLSQNLQDPNEHIILAGDGYVNTVSDVEMLIEEYKPDIVFVDGMYLLGRNKDQYARVTDNVRGLKRLAMRRKIPIIASSQFNRNVKSNRDEGLLAENIGFSDAIGTDSDFVIALFQTDDMKDEKTMMQKMLKNREDRPIEYLSEWDFDRMRFAEIEEDDFEDNQEFTSPTNYGY